MVILTTNKEFAEQQIRKGCWLLATFHVDGVLGHSNTVGEGEPHYIGNVQVADRCYVLDGVSVEDYETSKGSMNAHPSHSDFGVDIEQFA